MRIISKKYMMKTIVYMKLYVKELKYAIKYHISYNIKEIISTKFIILNNFCNLLINYIFT